MTVHGAKGLQAPIVFLPDTLQAPVRAPKLLWLAGDSGELPLWPPRAADQDTQCRAARDDANGARDQEYRRLLYVAMTRAEDRLYVCGWNTRKPAPDHCWYNIIRDAVAPACGEPVEDGFISRFWSEPTGARVLRLSNPQMAAPEYSSADTILPEDQSLPAWATRPPAQEPSPPRPLSPSRPDEDEPAVHAPFGKDDGRRFRRGRLIHRLLQSLPDLPAGHRAEATARFLGRAQEGLSYVEQAEIAGEVAAILAHPLFAPLFGPGSQAEVPLIGQWGERTVSGQVDRLLVTETEVLVVDYKTNRPPPPDAAGVASAYLRQMAAYRGVLACLYPGRTVRCALLWTDGPRLMALPAALLDDTLAGLGK
jgi:ATP-dependent helicase/nuclease subunit A